MSGGDWSIVLGVIIFIIGIVFATMYYLRYKKIFMIVYVASVSTYIFSVFYLWDVFELSKNWVMFMLMISTVIMFFLGRYFGSFNLKRISKK